MEVKSVFYLQLGSFPVSLLVILLYVVTVADLVRPIRFNSV